MNSILLREAYSHLAAIPASHVRLDTYHHVDGQGNVSGCLLGHLAIAHFAGLSLDDDGCLLVPDAGSDDTKWPYVAAIFGITVPELCDLVGYRGDDEPSPAAVNDKELLMLRFAQLFTKYDRTLHPTGLYYFLENV